MAESPWILATQVRPAGAVLAVGTYSLGGVGPAVPAQVWLSDNPVAIQLAVGAWGLQVYQGPA